MITGLSVVAGVAALVLYLRFGKDGGRPPSPPGVLV